MQVHAHVRVDGSDINGWQRVRRDGKSAGFLGPAVYDRNAYKLGEVLAQPAMRVIVLVPMLAVVGGFTGDYSLGQAAVGFGNALLFFLSA